MIDAPPFRRGAEALAAGAPRPWRVDPADPCTIVDAAGAAVARIAVDQGRDGGCAPALAALILQAVDDYHRPPVFRQDHGFRRPDPPGTHTLLAVYWEWEAAPHRGARFWACHAVEGDGRVHDWPAIGLRPLAAATVILSEGEGLDLLPPPAADDGGSPHA